MELAAITGNSDVVVSMGKEYLWICMKLTNNGHTYLGDVGNSKNFITMPILAKTSRPWTEAFCHLDILST